jgi:hypothetical protein
VPVAVVNTATFLGKGWLYPRHFNMPLIMRSLQLAWAAERFKPAK